MTAGFEPGAQVETIQDGDIAKSVFLKNYTFPEGVPQEWIDEYMDALDSVDALKEEKSALDEAVYFERLETLFLNAARANAKIRGFQSGDGSDT